MKCWVLMYADEDQWGRSGPEEIHGVVATLEEAVAWKSKGYFYYTKETKAVYVDTDTGEIL